MSSPIEIWKGLRPSDKAMFAGMVATILVWWIYQGKRTYSAKGMR